MRLCNTDLQINCFTFSHLYVVVQLVWIAAFLLLLWRACSLYGRAFLYPFFKRKKTKNLSLPQPTL
jgi:hypothetical protein